MRKLQLVQQPDGCESICEEEMEEIIDVQISEVKTFQGEVILQSKAIGSCIAVAAYDFKKKIGAMAHIMLPASAPKNKAQEKTKYAADAIASIVSKMSRLGSKNDDITVVQVGGGNILNKKDNTICSDNIESVRKMLEEKRLKVREQAVGGTKRRSVSLNVERGIVYYSEGNDGEMQLWRA